jgi:hypothetical protein
VNTLWAGRPRYHGSIPCRESLTCTVFNTSFTSVGSRIHQLEGYGHSLVYTVNTLWAGRPRYHGSIPCRERLYYRFLSSVKLKVFSRSKVAGACSWPLASIQCKHGRKYSSSPPHAFLARYLNKQRENCVFPYGIFTWRSKRLGWCIVECCHE